MAPEAVDAVVLNFGNPQCVLLGPAVRRTVSPCGQRPRATPRCFPTGRTSSLRSSNVRTSSGLSSGSAAWVPRRHPARARAPRWWPPRRSAEPRATRRSSLRADRSGSNGAGRRLPDRVGRGAVRRRVAARLTWHFLRGRRLQTASFSLSPVRFARTVTGRAAAPLLARDRAGFGLTVQVR